MTIQTYDYPASKAAHAKLEAAVDAFKANVKAVKESADDLVEQNTAEGVKSTMGAFQDKLEAQAKVMDDALEKSATILANSKAYHVANGGEE